MANLYGAKYDTLAGVALEICENYNRAHYRYHAAHLVWKVCFKHDSVGPRGSGPCYIWCEARDEAGDWDHGSGGPPHMVRAFERDKSWMKPQRDPVADPKWSNRSYCVNSSVETEIENVLPDYQDLDYAMDRDSEWLLRHGITVGQKFLVSYTESWSHDSYTGESDCDYEAVLLYVEPPPAYTAISVAFTHPDARLPGPPPWTQWNKRDRPRVLGDMLKNGKARAVTLTPDGLPLQQLQVIRPANRHDTISEDAFPLLTKPERQPWR